MVWTIIVGTIGNDACVYALRYANRDIQWWVSLDRKYGVNILTTVELRE